MKWQVPATLTRMGLHKGMNNKNSESQNLAKNLSRQSR